MANSVPGKIIGVRIGGVWLKCQTDATLNISVNVTEESSCKPDGNASTGNAIPWIERTADSRDWSVDFNAKFMKDSLSVENAPANVAKLIIDGDVYVDDFEFLTAADQEFSDFDMIYSGSGILTKFTFNAPAQGASNSTSTIVGNGALAYSYTS